jgi:hypothetical protein
VDPIKNRFHKKIPNFFSKLTPNSLIGILRQTYHTEKSKTYEKKDTHRDNKKKKSFFWTTNNDD